MHRYRLPAVLALLGLLVGAGCYQAPADMATAEMLLGISDAMTDLQNENAILQDQIDSLYVMVVRQDSIIRRIASQIGTPLPP